MTVTRMSNPVYVVALAACSLVAVIACDSRTEVIVDTQEPALAKLPERDAAFRLTSAERALVRPGFDIDAVERLLSHIAPEFRPEFFRLFQNSASGPAPLVTKIGDPTLQSILDEIYAPRWRGISDELLLHATDDLPGRQLEIERRHLTDQIQRLESR